MDQKFKCWCCLKKFQHKRNVYKHVRQIHKVALPLQVSLNCPECHKPCGKRNDVRSHLEQVHNIAQVSERISFSSLGAFYKWKQERERTTLCSYVKANGMHSTLLGRKVTFHCHRSGNFRSTSTGKRRSKSQGTNKLGKLCPACIEITVLSDGTVDGIFWKTHVGHLPDVHRLTLPHEEKAEIAKKLLDGVDETKILQDLKLSMNTEIERKHLTTREDLRNIKQRFLIKMSLHESEVEADDEQSVANWVEEMLISSYNPVLLYKKQDEEHPLLDSEDFFLVLMTPFQKTMCMTFSYDKVCIDTLHLISDNGFHLIAIILANKHEEGVPIALCITSTVTQLSLQLFFNSVKEIVPDLRPNIFISDDFPMFYDAWDEIFDSCEERLLCPWKVEEEWRKRLNMIKKKSKRDEIQKTLRALMYEFDSVSLHEMLDMFVMQLSESEDTREFHEYFMATYQGRVEMWSYCFRKWVKLNSPLHLETFHKNLKQICLHRRKPRRVDNCILKLIDLVNHKKFHDFITIQVEEEEEKSETVIDYLSNTNIPSSSIEDTSRWENFFKDDDTFCVTKNHICDSQCKLCFNIEGYKCTCQDFLISKYVCKHIPFLLQCFQAGDVNFQNDSNVAQQTFVAQKKEPVNLDSLKTQVLLLREKLNSVSYIDDKIQQKLHLSFDTVEQLLQTVLLKKSKHSSSKKQKKSSLIESLKQYAFLN